MSFSYDINHTGTDKKSGHCLMATNTLTTIINLFVTTFLVAHIYSFNGDTYAYLFNVGVYNIALYLFTALLYIPFSKIVDKTNRVCIFRIGLVLKAVLVVFCIFFGKELANLLLLAGALNGISEALYFASYNVIKQEMVSRKSIGSFASLTYVFNKIVEIICPILLGALIDEITYSYTAIIVLVICVAQVCVSFGIKAQKPDGSSFNLKDFFHTMKQRPDVLKKMSFMYFISGIYGFSILVTNLINVCIMLQFGSTFSLGAITSIFSVASILMILFVKKFTAEGKRSWLFIVAGLLPIVAVIIFAIEISPATVIILNGSISITSIIYKVLFDQHRNGTLKEAGLYDEIAEHHSIIEILANVSRAICFAILLLVSLANSLILFKVFVVISVVLCGGIFATIMVFERKYFKQPVKNIENSGTQTKVEDIEN